MATRPGRRIRIDTNKLLCIARELNQAEIQMQQIVSRFSHVTSAVNHAWKSEYTYDYIASVEAVSKKIKAIEDNTGRLSDVIKETVENIHRVEADNLKRFKANRR